MSSPVGIINISHYISFRYTICIYLYILQSDHHISLVNICHLQSYIFSCCRTFKIYSFSNFQICNIALFLKIYFIDYVITVIPFPPFISLHSSHPLPPAFHLFSSCPCVVHISSLASTFPILFLTSPCLFSTYYLCYLFSVPFPFSPPSPLITLHVFSISLILFLF